MAVSESVCHLFHISSSRSFLDKMITISIKAPNDFDDLPLLGSVSRSAPLVAYGLGLGNCRIHAAPLILSQRPWTYSV